MKSFKDILNRNWTYCKECKKVNSCYKKCENHNISGFCRKGKLKKKEGNVNE